MTPEYMQSYTLMDQSNRTAVKLFTSSAMDLIYKGVALSTVKKTKLGVSRVYDMVYADHFSKSIDELEAKLFIRSPIIQVDSPNARPTSKNNKVIRFPTPIGINFKTDVLITGTWYDKLDVNVS